MNIVEVYREGHKSLAILILGMPVEESNHHIFTEKLALELNAPSNNIGITYLRIKNDEDIDYSKIATLKSEGVIVSSDIILNREYFDFVIFIDTPSHILEGRGLKKKISTEAWDYFKKNYRINKFVNDTSYKKFYSANKIVDSLVYDKLVNSLLDAINK